MIKSEEYYVISAEGYCNGKREINYAGADVGYSGYPCWVSNYNSRSTKKFTNKEDARRYLFSEKYIYKYLVDDDYFKVDKSTISIEKVSSQFVEKIDVDNFQRPDSWEA